MYAMQWQSLSVLVSVLAAATSVELQCHHPGCFKFDRNGYKIGGSLIVIVYDEEQSSLAIDCNYVHVLDSVAMPRFTNEVFVSTIKLHKCPLPVDSIKVTLARFNVALSINNQTDVLVNEFPSLPAIESGHFLGLEQLTSLNITAQKGLPVQPTIRSPFFMLPNLRKLAMNNVRLTTATLRNLPRTVSWMWLGGTTLDSLPKSLSKTLPLLSNVRNLTLDYLMSMSRPSLSSIEVSNEKNTTRVSSLENLVVNGWTEREMRTLLQCDTLRTLSLYKPKAESLPDRWVAKCLDLEELIIDEAKSLISVPEKLLENANKLKTLTITRGVLQTLPAGFLKGAPNLKYLDLSNNQIHRVPAGAFLGPALNFCSLAHNELEMEAVSSLASYMGQARFVF